MLGLNQTDPKEVLQKVATACYYHQHGEPETASRLLSQALESGNPTAMEQYAVILYNQGQVEAAAEWAKRAICAGLCTGTRNIVFYGTYTTMLQHLQRDFDFVCRILAECRRMLELPPDLPLWNGQNIKAARILIPRQLAGYGDSVMWVRFVRELAQRGAQVSVDCGEPLAPLYQSIPGITIGRQGNETSYAYVEDIPYKLGIHTYEQIPPPPYLTSVNRFQVEDKAKLNIGISWGCGSTWTHARYSSLSEFSALAQIPNVQLYSLEKSNHAEQLYPPPVGMNIIDLASSINSFSDTAAAIEAMDLIVSTCNVNTNIAGALGKPLFVVLQHSHDHRWGLGEVSPWYPAAKIFRQKEPGNWREVVGRVAAAIEDYRSKN